MKLFLLALLFVPMTTIAQTGSIKGIITDAETAETVYYSKIFLSHGDSLNYEGKTITDFDGKFILNGIAVGTYYLKISHFEYEDKVMEVLVQQDRITILEIDVQKDHSIQHLEEVMVTISARKKTTIDAVQIQEKSMSSANESVQGKSRNSRGRKSKNQSNYIQIESEKDVRYNEISENGFQNVKRAPLSTFSIDVDNASYTNVRGYIDRGTLPPADAVRVEEFINYFDYEYPQPEENLPFSVTTEYTECPWNEENRLVHIGIQGAEMQAEDKPRSNLVFLIDVSGSMDGSNRLDLIKSGMLLLLEELEPKDKVAIVTYAGGVNVALASTSASNKEKIASIIRELQAGGSTNGGNAIHRAYEIAEKNFLKDGNNRVILATDGDFNVGITSQNALVSLIEKKREKDIFLSVIGVGTGNNQDSQMEQIADHGNGNYFYLDNLLEAKRVLADGLTGLIYTIAKDVKIQIEFNPEYVQSYRLLGYENRVLNDEDFNDDTKDAGELGSGHSVTALYEIVPKGAKLTESNGVDELKYQRNVSVNSSPLELMTVKLRYKNPDEKKSQLITQVCEPAVIPFEESSSNCQFASSVAEFGMLLRNSEFKANASYDNAIERAQKNKGDDSEEIRASCIQMMKKAALIQTSTGDNH